jgi:hypothetical protein
MAVNKAIFTAMALAAIQKFEEDVATPAPSLRSPGKTGNFVDDFTKRVSAFEDGIRGRVATSIGNRLALDSSLRACIEAGLGTSEVTSDILNDLDRLILKMDGTIPATKKMLEDMTREADQSIANAARLNPSVARALRKNQRRAIKALTGFIDCSVDTYNFLLAWRAEIDPEARGGPSFSDPAELEKYLREHLE